jgi:hypothetical protein
VSQAVRGPVPQAMRGGTLFELLAGGLLFALTLWSQEKAKQVASGFYAADGGPGACDIACQGSWHRLGNVVFEELEPPGASRLSAWIESLEINEASLSQVPMGLLQ